MFQFPAFPACSQFGLNSDLNGRISATSASAGHLGSLVRRAIVIVFSTLAFGGFQAEAVELQVLAGPFNSGKARVPCVFDGVKAQCMLDTGSAMTVVGDAKPFADYEPAGAVEFKSAAGVRNRTETIRIGEVRLDKLSFANVKVGRLTGRADAENMLGIDVLGRQPFALAFKQTPSLKLNPKPPTPLRSDLHVSKHGLLAIPVGFGEVRTAALWDTGASLTAVDPALIEKNPAAFKPLGKHMQGIDGGGNQLLVPVYRAKKINVGGRNFRNLRVVAVDLALLRANISEDIQAVAGFNLIRKADWHFDRAKKLWSIR